MATTTVATATIVANTDAVQVVAVATTTHLLELLLLLLVVLNETVMETSVTTSFDHRWR